MARTELTDAAFVSQITAALSPTTLEIYNDSHLHAHHKAMQGATSKETHFRCARRPSIPPTPPFVQRIKASTAR